MTKQRSKFSFRQHNPRTAPWLPCACSVYFVCTCTCTLFSQSYQARLDTTHNMHTTAGRPHSYNTRPPNASRRKTSALPAHLISRICPPPKVTKWCWLVIWTLGRPPCSIASKWETLWRAEMRDRPDRKQSTTRRGSTRENGFLWVAKPPSRGRRPFITRSTVHRMPLHDLHTSSETDPQSAWMAA